MGLFGRIKESFQGTSPLASGSRAHISVFAKKHLVLFTGRKSLDKSSGIALFAEISMEGICLFRR